MKDNHRYSKKEIHKIISDISLLKYDDYDIECFKQIYVDSIYIPYLISTYGRVISIHYSGKRNNPRILKTTYKCNGYESVMISVDERSKDMLVHRLVASTFIPNVDNKPQVNHIDGNKSNNHVWNLEWVSSKENIKHSYDLNLRYIRKGEEIGNNKYTEDMIRNVCELLEDNTSMSYKEIAKATGVSYNIVRYIRSGRSWTHISKEYQINNYTHSKQDIVNSVSIPLVTQICELLASGKYTIHETASMMNVSYDYVYGIIRGIHYKYISKNYNIKNYRKGR